MLDEVQGSKWVGSCAVARAAASLKFIAGPRWKVAPRLLFESCARRRRAKRNTHFLARSRRSAVSLYRDDLGLDGIHAFAVPAASPVHAIHKQRTA